MNGSTLKVPVQTSVWTQKTTTRTVHVVYLQQAVANMLNGYDPSLHVLPDEIVIDARGATLERVEEGGDR